METQRRSIMSMFVKKLLTTTMIEARIRDAWDKMKRSKAKALSKYMYVDLFPIMLNKNSALQFVPFRKAEWERDRQKSICGIIERAVENGATKDFEIVLCLCLETDTIYIADGNHSIYQAMSIKDFNFPATIKGIVVKAHGRANSKAIYNAIIRAQSAVDHKIAEQIKNSY